MGDIFISYYNRATGYHRLSQLGRAREDFIRAYETWPEHPIFGRLTTKDWGVFSYKHLDHHLRLQSLREESRYGCYMPSRARAAVMSCLRDSRSGWCWPEWWPGSWPDISREAE